MFALLTATTLALVPAVEIDYAADVAFALEQLEAQCAPLIESKGIDWKRVRKEFTRAAKDVEDDSQHLLLMTRLLARLRDGHARVENPTRVPWHEAVEYAYPGLTMCRIGKDVYVKSASGDAAGLGLVPGMELTKIDGKSPLKWIEAEVERMSDLRSFSTDQHARFELMSYGPAMPVGTRLDLELKFEGKRKKRTLTYAKGRRFRAHPGFLPEGLTRTESDHHYGTLASGHGYIHLRRAPGDLPAELDVMLAALGDVPGLVLDFRGNSGGGTDHAAVFGRFLPPGVTWQHGGSATYTSSGTRPFGGPLVVIVDGTVVSTGETLSGQFKEDGRAYMIGESPTAGMSSQKTTVELPSKLFSLYVSTRSNKGRFNGGRGIEGLGVEPHELVEYDPDDLVAQRDTLILRAVELLEEFPTNDVAYRPEQHGWTAPAR
ncbi:MAG: S41 family peptidase [Planctomycetota bacterium]